MWLDPGLRLPTGRFTYTYMLQTGTLTVYSISTKAHTSWLRNSFSWHAVVDICCMRQQNVIFHYFHNLPLSQKLDPRLYIDGHLSWAQHIDYLSKKIARNVGILSKLKRFLPMYIMNTLYYSLILSDLQYCTLLWAKTYSTYALTSLEYYTKKPYE